MNLQLDGAKALVFASSKGLGLASAKELAREGAYVAISSRSESNLDDAREEICAIDGVADEQVMTAVCDLSNTEAVASVVDRVLGEFGGLDVLVTNRGGPPERSFAEATLSDFDAIYDSVLKSTIVAIKTALPALKDGGGAITNIIATSTQEPTAHHVLANTIRPGIYGLSKSLSEEYGSEGIRVNCVTPRGIMTDRIRQRNEKFGTPDELSAEEMEERDLTRLLLTPSEHPVKRFADPEEFGRVVAFVSSDAASYVTGDVVNVDGGWSKHAF